MPVVEEGPRTCLTRGDFILPIGLDKKPWGKAPRDHMTKSPRRGGALLVVTNLRNREEAKLVPRDLTCRGEGKASPRKLYNIWNRMSTGSRFCVR